MITGGLLRRWRPAPCPYRSAPLRPTLTLEYFLRDQLGLEVIAAAPFRHDIHRF